MIRPLMIDLFAGAGGLSLGFEMAGFDVAAAVEIDPVHAAVHEHNFPYSSTVCADVSSLTGDIVRQRSGIGDREVHVVAGGAPCQGFSMMGKRDVTDPRNGLIAEFARMVVQLRPRHFILENVAGLLSGEHARYAHEFAEGMRSHGYTVVEPFQVLDASEFSVPQKRRRVFILGSRNDAPLIGYPPSVTMAGALRPPTEPVRKDALPSFVTVRDALCDLPDPGVDDEVPFDAHTAPVGFEYLRGYSRRTLTGCASTVHTEKTRERFASTSPGDVEKVSRFFRLHPEGVCNTLRAGSGSDRGSHTAARPIHPTQPRVITVREAARLHGYPDWFDFHATKWHGFREVGNSVPPPLACAVAREILRAEEITVQTPSRVVRSREGLRHLTHTEASKLFASEQSRYLPD